MSRRAIEYRIVKCFACGFKWRSAWKAGHWEQCPSCKRDAYRAYKSVVRTLYKPKL